MLNTALAYLRHGWSIFPLVARGKVPAISSWRRFMQERPSEAQVKAWWTYNPNLNIAVVTGTVSGIFVVDFDNPELAQDFRAARDYTPTLSVNTARGAHFYYQLPGFVVRNQSDTDRHIDIRGDGGYVVAPPSIHPSGVKYQWVKAPIQCPPASVVEMVRDMRTSAKPKPKTFFAPKARGFDNSLAIRLMSEQCNRIASSNDYRNNTLFYGAIMAGHFIRDGYLTRTECESALESAASSAGLEEREIPRTIKSGIDRGIADPKR